MKYIYPRKRQLTLTPAIWNLESQLSKQVEKIHGKRLTKQYAYLNKGMYTATYEKKEWDEVAQHFVTVFLKDPTYFERIHQLHNKKKQEIQTFLSKHEHISELTTQKLVTLAREIKRVWMEFDATNLCPRYIGADLFQDHIIEELKRSTPKITEEEITVLLTNPKPSFGALEEISILELAKQVKEKQLQTVTFEKLPREIQKCIQELVKHYYWIPYGYEGPDTYDEKHYVKTIQERIQEGNVQKQLTDLQQFFSKLQKQQNELIKKYAISKELQKRIAHLSLLSELADERKEWQTPLHVLLYKVHQEIGKREHIDMLTFKHTRVEELQRLVEKEEQITEEIKYRKTHPYFVHYENDTFSILTGKEMEELREKVLQPVKQQKLKGVVVSKGKEKIIQGIARIVRWAHHMQRVEQGDILVTTMTTPEFLPAMRKAKAIITDEGGVTSHAAIVSRELNIPCIIGTKHATELLQDEDTIMMNTRTGTIKKI